MFGVIVCSFFPVFFDDEIAQIAFRNRFGIGDNGLMISANQTVFTIGLTDDYSVPFIFLDGYPGL